MRERDDLPFSMDEYRERLARVRAEMDSRGFELLMAFSPENMYYLTGYKTKGYYAYQCLFIPLSGEPFMITRHLEAPNVPYQTWVERCDDYRDEEDPIGLTRDVLEANGLSSANIGIELNSWFLTAANYLELCTALSRATFRDSSGLVEHIRMIKSPREIAYTRKAAAAASAGMRAALAASHSGALDSEIAAAAYSARVLAGSEYVASPVYVVSGPKSGLAHNNWEGRRLEPSDVVFYEIGASTERYHAASMRSAVIGDPPKEIRRAAEAARAGLEAALSVMGPGVKAADADAACRSTIARLGFGDHHYHRLGYHLGIAFPPTWVQRGVFSINKGVEDRLSAGMVFHLVPSVMIPGVGGLGCSETVLVTSRGVEVLTSVEATLFVC